MGFVRWRVAISSATTAISAKVSTASRRRPGAARRLVGTQQEWETVGGPQDQAEAK